MNRIPLVQAGLAGCMILAGACWVNGQQGRPAYRPQEDLSGGVQAESEFQGHGQFQGQGSQAAHMPGQRSSSLVGSCVKLGDGQVLGRIEDLMINEDGCVDFMVVSFNGMSEFGGRLAAIPWSVGRMDFRSRIVTLDVERDTLRSAPIFFSRGRVWPNLYEPQWAASVHNYFGVESDMEQRLERAYSPGADENMEEGRLNRDARPGRDLDSDMPEPRIREQRQQTRQGDRHLDPKPSPANSGINSDNVVDPDAAGKSDQSLKDSRDIEGQDLIRNSDDGAARKADSTENDTESKDNSKEQNDSESSPSSKGENNDDGEALPPE